MAAIEGATVRLLRINEDARGRLMEILRNDDPEFSKFGQVYMTTARPGVVKAWHYHRLQEDNFTVLSGSMRLVLYDNRETSPTRGNVMDIVVSEHRPAIVHIPRMVMHGFQALPPRDAVVINTVSEPYNREQPDEYRLPPDTNEVPFDWYKRVDG